MATFREELTQRIRAWRESTGVSLCPQETRAQIEADLRAEWGPGRGGFASLTSDALQEISAKGGRAANASGRAHRFTSEKARVAGALGGATARDRGTTHKFTSEEAQAANRVSQRRRWVYGLGQGPCPPKDDGSRYDLRSEAEGAAAGQQSLWRSPAKANPPEWTLVLLAATQ